MFLTDVRLRLWKMLPAFIGTVSPLGPACACMGQTRESPVVVLEVPAWAPLPGRGSPPLGLPAQAVQPGVTRPWPGMGDSRYDLI